jgi:hypothetical protein
MKRIILKVFGVSVNGYDLLVYGAVLTMIILLCYNVRIYHLNQ